MGYRAAVGCEELKKQVKMVEQNEKPTLQDLSKQIFAIANGFEEAADVFKGLEDLPENERDQTALGVVVNLVHDISTAIKTAIETNHPAVYKTLTSWDDPISAISLFASTERELIEALEGAFARLEERTWREYPTQEPRDWHEWSLVRFPKRFIQPYKLLYKHCMKEFEQMPRYLKMAADDLAGVFLQEQTAAIEDSDSVSKKAAELTDTESNILEALGNDTLRGSALLKKAGYDNSSHYRGVLSNLVKRDILGRNDRGYFRKCQD